MWKSNVPIFPEFIYIPPMPVEAAALRGVTGMPPFIPPAPVLMPVPEPSLAAMLIHQIDYYFRYFDTTFFFLFPFLFSLLISHPNKLVATIDIL